MAGLADTGAICLRSLAAALVTCIAATLAWAVPAEAASGACSRAQRSDLRQATSIAGQLVSAGAAGNVDVAGVVDRARHRCSAAPFAIAVATLTRNRGSAIAGRSYRFRQLELVGAAGAGGTVVYRLDLPAMARRWHAAENPVAANRRFTALASAAVGVGASVLWAPDPTVARFDWSAQAGVAEVLSRSDRPAARDLAVRSLPPLRRVRRIQALAGQPLLVALHHAVLAQRAAVRVGGDRNLALAARLARQALPRARRADSGTWSRIDGHWATGKEHRRLVALARASARLGSSPALATQAEQLARYLTTRPQVSLRRIPLAAFYPWPLDGVRDTSTVRVHVNKPATLTMKIYAPDHTVVQTVVGRVVPGVWVGSWNGLAAGGARAAEGAYRYALHTVDRAGNRAVTPGLGQFTVAIDRTAPRIADAHARYLSGNRRRVFRVRWKVVEPLSPTLRVVLVARRTGIRVRAVAERQPLEGATNVALRLPAGRFRIFVKVFDGSGNVSSTEIGYLTMP